MYNDPNAQPPYEQQPPSYATPYELQYSQPANQLYPPTQYGEQSPYSAQPQYGMPPIYVPPPQQPQQSYKTLWIILGSIFGGLLLIGGICTFSLYAAASQTTRSLTNNLNNINATVTADEQSFNATATASQGTAIADEVPPARQADLYYTAIQVQDYTNAYSMLASDAIGPGGSKLTQAQYTSMATQADSANGQVTNATATVDPSNPHQVTVQVTRQGGKNYTIHLTFTQGSFSWLISSFDGI